MSPRKAALVPHLKLERDQRPETINGNGGAASHEEEPPGEQVERLRQVLEAYRRRKLVIFLKGYPDPDSIGSALAHQYICHQLGVETDIVHFEDPSHQENKALVKRLSIKMVKWSPELDLSQYAGYCCVDAQSPQMPIPLPEHLKLVSFVDHHKRLGGPIDGEFVDVREDAGSTSAIYAEYLQVAGFELEGAEGVEAAICTALMHGIRTDTDDFLLATEIDFAASAFLSPLVDRELLTIISRQSISPKSMDILQVALERKTIRGTYCIAGVGYVREEDRDGIGEAADYLLRREGVDTVLVYGIVGREYIDGSLRTNSDTVDPDRWMKDLFGIDSKGQYYGGGRTDKGGFQIPLGFFSGCSDRDLLWKLVSHRVEDVFFEKIGESRGEG